MNAKNCHTCAYGYFSVTHHDALLLCECVHKEHCHLITPEECSGCDDWAEQSGKSIYDCLKAGSLDAMMDGVIESMNDKLGCDVTAFLDSTIGVRETLICVLKRLDVKASDQFDNILEDY